MKILVTGGTGFLGRYVVRRLVDAGDAVRILVRTSRAVAEGMTAGAEIIAGDLCDPPSLRRALHGLDAVCHCAARMETRGSWSEFEEVTVRGTERLLEAACDEHVKRFLHVSSLGVHGLDGQKTITEDSPLDESPGERGHYTRSKIESERLVWRYARERGLSTTVVRPGILFGPGRPPVVGRLVVPLGRKLRIVVGRPAQRLPLAHVENVAAAIDLALHCERTIGRAYNIVDDEALYQGEYLALLRQFRRNGERTFLFPPAPLQLLISSLERVCRWIGMAPIVSRHQLERALASPIYETSRARKELGWNPQVDLVDALRKMREAGPGQR